MDKKVVQRRVGGRHNRGGGRQSRRGRGHVNTRPVGPSVSGRKSGASAYDDDDIYDAYDDDGPDSEFSESPLPPLGNQFAARGVPSFIGRGRGSFNKSSASGGGCIDSFPPRRFVDYALFVKIVMYNLIQR